MNYDTTKSIVLLSAVGLLAYAAYRAYKTAVAGTTNIMESVGSGVAAVSGGVQRVYTSTLDSLPGPGGSDFYNYPANQVTYGDSWQYVPYYRDLAIRAMQIGGDVINNQLGQNIIPSRYMDDLAPTTTAYDDPMNYGTVEYPYP